MTTLSLPRYPAANQPSTRSLAALIAHEVGVKVDWATDRVVDARRAVIIVNLHDALGPDVDAACKTFLEPHGIEWEVRG
jgi:hypothetical protein